MKLIDNHYGSVREVQGFTKDELLKVKNKISELKEKETEEESLEEFLKVTFPLELLESHSIYLENIKQFMNSYLKDEEGKIIKIGTIHGPLKAEILAELQLNSQNLLNLKLNCQNTIRFHKNEHYLEEFFKQANTLLESSNEMKKRLESLIEEPTKRYEDQFKFWLEVNKIKNLVFIIEPFSDSLLYWHEYAQLKNLIHRVDLVEDKKKKKRKKGKEPFRIHFNDVLEHYSKNHQEKLDFYMDLFLLLILNGLCKEDTDEFVNVLEKKEVKRELGELIHPILRELIIDKFDDVLNEIIKLDSQYHLDDEEKSIQPKAILQLEINQLVPQVIDYYFIGIEKKYQEVINNTEDQDEFRTISEFYSEKADILWDIIDSIEKYVNEFDQYVKPYESILESFRKTLEGVSSEIQRRKEEYLYYIKMIRKERLRDNIRSFVSEKIEEINKLMVKYQDETALVIREEFPQLKRVREIIKNYKESINSLKDQVIKKLDVYKKKDIDLYQIIKQWEDNFNTKRQQLSFLLSTLLTKLYKNFKELLESEEMVFDHLTELKESSKEAELPLNFSITNTMIDKLTEEEIKERITELNSKLSQISEEKELYQEELQNLENKLETRIKLREGILTSDVVCSVCHKHIKIGKEQLIKCPFCEAVFHYLCVAFWLSKYNSCPSCQNQFLDPNAGLFEPSGEEGS